MANVDGTGRKSIVANDRGTTAFGPTWSPDGQQIAFSVFYRTGRGGVGFLIRVVDADGKNLRPLGGPQDLFPAWSPDGKQLLFTRLDDPEGLCVMDKDGRNVRKLVEGSAGSWSPDGQHLAYIVTNDGATGLFVARADGSDPRRISGGAAVILGPAHWSPDGKRLFFTRQVEGGTLAVHAIDVDGRNPRKLSAVNTPEYLGGSFIWGRLSSPEPRSP